MARYQILYWQEIPSFVEARDGDEVKKIQLSDRFQALIDEAAMRREIAGTDGYLEEWNKGNKVEQDGSVEEIAETVAKEIEDRFAQIRDEALAKTA